MVKDPEFDNWLREQRGVSGARQIRTHIRAAGAARWLPVCPPLDCALW